MKPSNLDFPSDFGFQGSPFFVHLMSAYFLKTFFVSPLSCVITVIRNHDGMKLRIHNSAEIIESETLQTEKLTKTYFDFDIVSLDSFYDRFLRSHITLQRGELLTSSIFSLFETLLASALVI